jgi:hypothetical protein
VGLVTNPVLETMEMKDVTAGKYLHHAVHGHGLATHDAERLILELLGRRTLQNLVQSRCQAPCTAALLYSSRQITKRYVQITNNVEWYTIVRKNDEKECQVDSEIDDVRDELQVEAVRLTLVPFSL